LTLAGSPFFGQNQTSIGLGRCQKFRVRNFSGFSSASQRRRAIDEVLDDVLREKPSKISAAKLLEESRR